MDVQEQVEGDWTLEREYRFSVFAILEPFAFAWCILVLQRDFEQKSLNQ